MPAGRLTHDGSRAAPGRLAGSDGRKHKTIKEWSRVRFLVASRGGSGAVWFAFASAFRWFVESTERSRFAYVISSLVSDIVWIFITAVCVETRETHGAHATDKTQKRDV